MKVRHGGPVVNVKKLTIR